ncbi:hypothetical protein [Melaminivora sp.]|nr:hypothetical protein [Melaminivora sp.]
MTGFPHTPLPARTSSDHRPGDQPVDPDVPGAPPEPADAPPATPACA